MKTLIIKINFSLTSSPLNFNYLNLIKTSQLILREFKYFVNYTLLMREDITKKKKKKRFQICEHAIFKAMKTYFFPLQELNYWALFQLKKESIKYFLL